MKKSMFGGYDRQEMDSLLEELQEKTNQATIRAAELETALQESGRQAEEKLAGAAAQAHLQEQQADRLESRIEQLSGENEALGLKIAQLERSVEDYERKISMVGQIYITAYDDAEKITSHAKSRTGEAVDAFSRTVQAANLAMQSQLGNLIMARESMKETMASANLIMQQSFELFTSQSREIDRALLDVEALSAEIKTQMEQEFDRIQPVKTVEKEEDASGNDLVELFQKEVPAPGSIDENMI